MLLSTTAIALFSATLTLHCGPSQGDWDTLCAGNTVTVEESALTLGPPRVELILPDGCLTTMRNQRYLYPVTSGMGPPTPGKLERPWKWPFDYF